MVNSVVVKHTQPAAVPRPGEAENMFPISMEEDDDISLEVSARRVKRMETLSSSSVM